jgi:hypothetical protein
VVIAKPAPKAPGKFLVYTSFAFNAYTYLGPTTAPSSISSSASGGLALSPALQVVLMLNQRVSFALTPTVALAWRF